MVFRQNRLFVRLMFIAVFVLLAAGAQYLSDNRESLPQEAEKEGLEITKLGNGSYSDNTNGFATGDVNAKEFVIKENEGLIAIYEVTPIGLRLVKQTDFRIDGLELELRERIITGIPVDTQENIEHLLESWDS